MKPLMHWTLLAVASAFALSMNDAGSTNEHGGNGYECSWYTVDGGGAMFSAGGNFELSGTIGQPDAGVMTGGSLILTGGFWVPAAEGGCACQSEATCPNADVNCDDVVNGLDIAVISSSANFGLAASAAAEPCADVNGDGMVNGLDVAAASSSACFGQ